MRILLKHKVIGLVSLAALLPAVGTLVAIVVLQSRVEHRVSDELDHLTRENIAQIVTDVYRLCKASHETIVKRTQQGLAATHLIMKESGGIRLSPRWSPGTPSMNERVRRSR